MTPADALSFSDAGVFPASQEAPTIEVDADTALMVKAAAGSQEAFAALVEKHHGALLNFFRRSGAHAESEDLVQETFVRLFRYRRQYQPSARFTTFLYLLARHTWADRGRKIQRQERLAAGLQNEAEVDAGTMVDLQPGSALDVEAALGKLSPKLREVIVLSIYQGLRYKEIADVVGVPLGTVKSRVSLALDALRKVLHA